MITLTLTPTQLNTIQRALSNYDFDLYYHYERTAERDDEVRLVQEAIAAVGQASVARHTDDPRRPGESLDAYKARKAAGYGD